MKNIKIMEVFGVEKLVIWSEYGKEDAKSYLLPENEVEECADYSGELGFMAINNVPKKSFSGVKVRLESVALESDSADWGYINSLKELNMHELEQVLVKELGYEDAEVFFLEEYPTFDEEILVFDRYNNEFHDLSKDNFTVAKRFDYVEDGNLKHLIMEEKCEQFIERDIVACDYGLETAGGLYENTAIYPLLEDDGRESDLFLKTDYRRDDALIQGVVVDKGEVIKHLKEKDFSEDEIELHLIDMEEFRKEELEVLRENEGKKATKIDARER